MKHDQTERFKLLLESNKEELLREISDGRERFQIDPASDPIDRADNIVLRESATEDVERKTAILRAVEGALQEIGEGTFGTCNVCGKRIPVKRLEAMPWSPYCVQCQERAEGSAVSAPVAVAS